MKFRIPSILKIIPWLSVLVLALLSWYFLVLRNADVLYMQQLRTLFNDTQEFYLQYHSQPAGFLMWLGCFFTQLFYFPALGSSILICIWAATFFFMKKALGISNALSPILLLPFVFLLVSEIDLGYWIYYTENNGYFFSPSIGLLLASILVYLFGILPDGLCRTKGVVKYISALFVAATYPLLGIYSLITLATISIMLAMNSKWIQSVFCILLVIGTPLFGLLIYIHLDVTALYSAGLPIFQMRNVTSSSLTTPIIYTLLLFVGLAFINKIGTRLKKEKTATIISLSLLIIITVCSYCILKDADYDDDNYHAECKAYREIEEQQWDEVLNTIGQVKGTLTRQLIIFKNIALFNTGNIGNSMYDYDNKGKIPSTRDSLNVNMSNTAAPMIYLHHGMTNLAYRYCMEIQVEFGYNITSLKIMALSAIISGEGKLAEKYLNILSHTMFYKKWAEHYLPLARNPKLIDKYPELAKINDLHSCHRNEIEDDNGICENHIVLYYATTKNEGSKYFQEMTLLYNIVIKDIESFWPRYLKYLELHKDEKVPEVYQQVAYFYAVNKPDMAPESQEYYSRFDKAVIDRYNSFNQEIISLVNLGISEAAIAQQTKEEYGNTFWWAYYYNQDVMCY